MNSIFTVSVIEARYPYYPTLYRNTKTKPNNPYKPAPSYKHETPAVQYFWSTPILEYTSANSVAAVTTPVAIYDPVGNDCLENESCKDNATVAQKNLQTTEMNEITLDVEENSSIPKCGKGESVINGSCTNRSPNDVSDGSGKYNFWMNWSPNLATE